jgi:DNA repair exonuclease SbcCD ATPase subunit
LREAVQQADWAIAQRARHETENAPAIAAAEQEAAAAEQAARKAHDDAIAYEHRMRVLEQVERVLGLRGVRSTLLEEALAGLELLARGRLARVFPELDVRVVARTERGSKTVEAIAIVAKGAGDDAGYAALSGGQRRRVDMALMLSLAELADGALGEEEGALFFDEVFDALDAEGVAAFSELIAELAERRQVWVVSHNPALVSALLPSAAVRLEVADGKVAVR